MISGMGINETIMFYGVVEDRNDPLKIGRCKIRCLGFHTNDKELLPTSDLPWSIPLIPITNCHGKNVYPPREGLWVWGFFRDGKNAQFPIYGGILSGIPSENVKTSKGFNDPRVNLSGYPKKITSKTYNSDGSGITINSETEYNYPEEINEPDTSKLARNEDTENTIIKEKEDNRVTSVSKASTKNSTGETWNEPLNPYNATYPFNDVKETESGHIQEFDDTPGAERIHTFHRTGTFDEIHPNGDKVTKIVGNGYEIYLKDNNIYVMGECNLTTKGKINIYSQDETNIHSKGKMNVYGENQCSVYFSGSIDIESQNKIELKSNKNITLRAPKIEHFQY